MAYYNVDTLLTELQRNSLQRTSQFRCKIPVQLIGDLGVANNLATRYPQAAQLLQKGLLCESTRTPSRQFDTTTMTIYGYEEKFPTFTTYADMECTFMIPMTQDTTGEKTSLEVVELFHAWQNLIQPISSQNSSNGFTERGDMVLSFPIEYRLQDGMTLEQFDPYNAKRNTGQVNITGRLGPLTGQLTFGNARADTEPAPTIVYRFRNVYPLTIEPMAVSWSSIDEYQKLVVSFAYSYWTSDNSSLYG
jgi:hypothetical protein